MPDSDPRGWVRERDIGLAGAVLSIGLLGLILLPYLKYILLAGVIAYVLRPAHSRVSDRIHPQIAAVLVTFGAFVAIILPVMYILAVAIREAVEAVAVLQEEGTIGAVERRLAEMGFPLGIDELRPVFEEPIRAAFEGLATSAIEVVGGVAEVLIGLTVTLFVLYALLYEGDALLAWMRALLPIDREVETELIEELDQLIWASIVGNVAIAGIQAILIGIAVLVLGIPGVVLIAVITFVVALLPLIGVVVVWVPLAAYLLVVGRPVAAAGLIGYGLLVSVADNYLRPALIGRGTELDVATVAVGIFGGVAVFGFVGLFVGPVMLGGSKIVLETIFRPQGG